MVVGTFHHHPPLLLLLTSSTGESGLGKSTWINTLFSTELSPPKNYRARYTKQMSRGTEVEIMKAELEERGFTLKVSSDEIVSGEDSQAEGESVLCEISDEKSPFELSEGELGGGGSALRRFCGLLVDLWKAQRKGRGNRWARGRSSIPNRRSFAEY
jgi:hypothetical protein